jgi:hypothetical protein
MPRWNSSATFLEYPLVSIAMGPDAAANETRGHARGIIAIGDIATGVIALGGVARGLIAFGGFAVGALAFGGAGIGMLAFGGLALGYLAAGGLAIGYAAIGGLAIGHYAVGGAAIGHFTISPLHHDREVVDYFSKFWRGLPIPPSRSDPHSWPRFAPVFRTGAPSYARFLRVGWGFGRF